MKFLSATVLMLALVSSVAMGQSIVNSGHDFHGNSWSGGEICVPCHTPHNATATSDAPLWNRALNTSTYTLYSGFDMQASAAQPGTASKLCLSCHDGAVALENFGGVTTGTTNITGRANLGSTLADDHPVGITYNTALVGTGTSQDNELYDPSTQNSGLGGTIDADLLVSSKVECSSCHDPHNNQHGNFLVMDNSGTKGSDLCLTCHNK